MFEIRDLLICTDPASHSAITVNKRYVIERLAGELDARDLLVCVFDDTGEQQYYFHWRFKKAPEVEKMMHDLKEEASNV